MSFLSRIRRALKFPVPHDQRLLAQNGHVTELRHTLTVHIQHTSPGIPKIKRTADTDPRLSGLTPIAAHITAIPKIDKNPAASVINALSCAVRDKRWSNSDLLIVLGDGPSRALSHNFDIHSLIDRGGILTLYSSGIRKTQPFGRRQNLRWPRTPCTGYRSLRVNASSECRAPGEESTSLSSMASSRALMSPRR
jgi:hypothetical protein